MQVMERFEKENGGELVVATLCLLEVSKFNEYTSDTNLTYSIWI